MSPKPRLAFVQDALPFRGGAERTLEAALEIFPEAEVYTLVYNPARLEGTTFSKKNIHTSFINRLPGRREHYRSFLPFYPFAMKRFDLREYDLVISFSYATALGIKTHPRQLHISYTYTPLRRAWHAIDSIPGKNGDHSDPEGWAIELLMSYFRHWSRAAACRVDRFVASSKWISSLIWTAYQRRSEVIYPPVDIDAFQPSHRRDNFYLVLSRMSAHKKVPMIVEAFSRLGYPLIVIGDGVEYHRLERIASSNIQLLGWQPDHVVRSYLGRAKALVHAAEEDFGIALVEAQAAGCPVITYAGGGALETVVPEETGLFFAEQSVDSLVTTVKTFEASGKSFDPAVLRRNAEHFRKECFQSSLFALVEREWQQFLDRGGRSAV
jgi:glycosyltransferase involved in cell wall biosynthesis